MFEKHRQAYYNNIMLENRKNPRFRSFAQVRIPNILGGEHLLKDISITGCCIEFTVITEIQPNNRYQIEVIPEKASKLGSFELTVECRWVHGSSDSSDIGFSVIASPKGRLFQRYVDYLAYRNSLL